MMSRLIDADRLKAMIFVTLDALRKNPKMDGQEMHLIVAFKTLYDMVEDQPTVDISGIVRCQDCKYYEDEYMWCADYREPDWYCAEGVKGR